MRKKEGLTIWLVLLFYTDLILFKLYQWLLLTQTMETAQAPDDLG